MAGERRLAAILFSDIVGYTALMGADEAAGLRARTRHRTLLRGLAARHRGRIVDENGDELVLVFPSDLDAVRCALAAQGRLREDLDLTLRIGIHSGDVVFEGGRVYGDGVNVASRIRPLAEPGGVAISEPVHDAVKGQAGLALAPLGTHTLKNVAHPLAVYTVSGEVETPSRIAALRRSTGGRRAAIAACAAIAVAAALWLARGWLPSSPAEPASVVVLPFADISEGSDQEYFADGMTEEIINTLARLPDLRVVARTSAFAFKGKGADIRKIGDQLGVRHALEGSVRRSGGRLRVTAQLVSVADGYHLWSETYDRELSDVFAIQEDVATRVAEALSVRIVGRSLASRPLADLRAYELYLTGRQLWSLRTEEEMRRAVEYFEQALALEPDYAPALSGISDALSMLWVYGFEGDRSALERAREAAEVAVRSDPQLGAAHTSLGLLSFNGGRWEWIAAEEHLRRGIELDPGSATAHLWYAVLLMNQARAEEARAEIQRALELDPLSVAVLTSAGLFWSLLGNQDRAIELLRRAVDLAPEGVQTRWILWEANADAGLEREALEAALAAAAPSARGTLRGAYERGGQKELRERFLRMEQERTGLPCGPRPALGAVLNARIGRADETFRCLDLGARTGETNVFARLNPVFAPYRSDPRYRAYLESINLAD